MEDFTDNKVKALLAQVEEDQKHFAAIGQFITAYSLAEAIVHSVARQFSGIDDELARIIFAGMRLGDVAERLRGLTRSKGEIYSEIDACLTHLDGIATIRHKLVHRTVTLLPTGGMKVDNSLIAKSSSASETETVHVEILQEMTVDCAKIAVRLLLLADPNTSPNEAAQFRAEHGAWRYKPPPPAPRAKERPATPR